MSGRAWMGEAHSSQERDVHRGIIQQQARTRKRARSGRCVLQGTRCMCHLTLSVFETNGKVREARKLHSITLMRFSFDKNWMLNGPEIWRRSAILNVTRFTRLSRAARQAAQRCGTGL